MRRFALTLAFVLLVTDTASAGLFRRTRKTTCTNAAACTTPAVAQPATVQPVAAQPVVYTGGQFSTAQGVAEYMARTGIFGHFGGNSGYEGCGMAATPEAAEMICCYRNQFQPREVGLAQGANGFWYACCRY